MGKERLEVRRKSRKRRRKERGMREEGKEEWRVQGSSKAGPSQGIADADKELRRAAIALAAGKRAEEEGSEGRSSGCWS